MCQCCGVNANLIHRDSGIWSSAPFLYLWALKIYRLLSWREMKKLYIAVDTCNPAGWRMGVVLRAQDQTLHHWCGIELNSSAVPALCVAKRASRERSERLFKRHQSDFIKLWFHSCNNFFFFFFLNIHKIMRSICPCHFSIGNYFDSLWPGCTICFTYLCNDLYHFARPN